MLLDGNRTQPQPVELIPGKPAGKTKALAVVIHNKHHAAIVLRQFYHDMGSLRMLFYVVECFSVNLEKLAADPVGSLELDGVNQEIQSQGGFVAETLREAGHEIEQVGALDTQGPHVRDHVAEIAG